MFACKVAETSGLQYGFYATVSIDRPASVRSSSAEPSVPCVTVRSRVSRPELSCLRSVGAPERTPQFGLLSPARLATAAAAGAGWWLGWQPRAKVSMIMRPPQQRHGRGIARGSSAAAVAEVSTGFGRDGTTSNSRARARLAARLPLANNP